VGAVRRGASGISAWIKEWIISIHCLYVPENIAQNAVHGISRAKAILINGIDVRRAGASGGFTDWARVYSLDGFRIDTPSPRL